MSTVSIYTSNSGRTEAQLRSGFPDTGISLSTLQPEALTVFDAPLLPAFLSLSIWAPLRYSQSYLVGVICLGVDKHPPTSFLATPVSTYRCLRKDAT